MKFYLCIDDTDNIDSIGTGTIAGYIREHIEAQNWANCTQITRHQLLIHEDIPYTSHNSSMCFVGELKGDYIDEIRKAAIKIIEEFSAEGSDPGFCLYLQENEDEREDKLIQFGREAKEKVLTKDMAYELAKNMGIHLSEHGGTGQGVIGALAGVGLRLSGNDGEVKGSLKKITLGEYTVRELTDLPEIDEIIDLKGNSFSPDCKVIIESKSKSVHRNYRFILYVHEENGVLKTYNKKEIRKWES
ncbi:hypothetical protein [Oceanirhabdus seepicola]|uniref:Uncharacterized protein n=1 Tax=Oceanirhabdus seepicola TaxID=2828781 RepID=A0A9J6P043_9CLOT|nr:hypothetical protein [Oceanirhabdus seepicola]MCM1989481.1 hypothetical protein [Oceanirhabdus seepicola]